MGQPRATALVTVLLSLPCWPGVVCFAGGEVGPPGEKKPSPPRSHIEELLRQAREVVERDPRRALELAEQAEARSRRPDDRRVLARVTFIRADAARVQGDHRAALELYHEARRRFAELGEGMELGRSLRRLGDMYYFLTDYESALRHYLEALRRFEELARLPDPGPAPLHIAHLQAAIGNVLRALGDIPRAMEYYQSALARYQALDYPGGVAGCRYNLGGLQQDLKQMEAALASYEEARRTAESLGDQYLLSLALAGAGSVHLAAGHLEEAEAFIVRALEVCQRTDRRRGIADNLIKLAGVRRRQGDLNGALRAVREGLSLAERLEDRRMAADAHRELAEVYDAMGRPALALASFRRFQAIDEEVVGTEKAARVNKLVIAFESARKEQEIAVLEGQRRAERTARWAVTAMLGLAMVVIGLLVAGYRLKVRSANAIAATNAALERALGQVEVLARTDELTGLYNRRGVMEILTRELARVRRQATPLALALADIDDFKRINDTFGHRQGDEVLKRVASAIVGCVRSSDAVARWGGEEFLIVLPDTNLEGAARVAEKIRAAVASGIVGVAAGPGVVTVTLGVSICSDGDFDAALRRADAAVYEGKAAGKNTVRVAMG